MIVRKLGDFEFKYLTHHLQFFYSLHLLFCTSLVDEVARKTLEAFKSLSGDESYQSRDLEKVTNLVEFKSSELINMISSYEISHTLFVAIVNL